MEEESNASRMRWVKTKSIIKEAKEASKNLREEVERKELHRVTNYNPFLSYLPSKQLNKQLGVEMSSSLGSKKVEHTLFVGGEYLRNLSKSEVLKHMMDRNK